MFLAEISKIRGCSAGFGLTQADADVGSVVLDRSERPRLGTNRLASSSRILLDMRRVDNVLAWSLVRRVCACEGEFGHAFYMRFQIYSGPPSHSLAGVGLPMFIDSCARPGPSTLNLKIPWVSIIFGNRKPLYNSRLAMGP